MKNDTVLIEELNRYYEIWQETNHIYAEWAKAHGISVSLLLALCAIDDDTDNCTQKKISQRWLIPKQTVNTILKDLVNKKFVRLIPVKEDKRNKRIQFTAAGKEYADTILSNLRKVELSTIQKMGIERMRRLNEDGELFLRLLRENGGETVHDTEA